VCAGGAGYGDPLERAPAAVLKDAETGLISRRVAADVYGVVLQDHGHGGAPSIDEATTAALRGDIRARRLSGSKRVGDVVAEPKDARATVLGRVGDALKIVSLRGHRWFVCMRCDQPMSETDRDPKHGALWREVPMQTYSDWNRFGLASEIEVREFCCPSCAHLIAVQVARRSDPILFDMALEPDPTRLSQAAE